MSDGKTSGLSFSFAKKKETKLLSKPKSEKNDYLDNEDTDYIVSLEGKEVKSKIQKAAKKELVIPLINANRWRHARRPDELENEADKTDVKKSMGGGKSETDVPQDEAVKELLQEAAAAQDNWEDRGQQTDRGLNIPLLMQNKVPEGFETDEKLNVDLRPDEPAEADYDSIPIEQYGLAMLRGMGFKDGEGIGKNNKDIKPVEAVPRPKGLGLGADRSIALQAKGVKNKKHDKNAEEELTIKKGAFCLITKKGKYKDLYGMIEGIDEDNSHVILKLALSGDSITISQFAIQLVNKKEYGKFSKYLNKGKADRFKEEQAKQNGTHDSGSESDRREKHKKKHKHRSRSRSRERHRKRSRSRDRSRSRSKERHRKRSRSHSRDRHRSRSPVEKSSKYEKHKDRSNVANGSSSQKQMWLRPHLRVRIVDQDYKKGKYFKSKVVIEDVISLDSCICRTDEGRILENITQSMLETVIPRSDPAHVMITSGRHRGQVGEVLKKDKSSCLATVQLLSDRDNLVQLDFDHICEYMGDVHEQFDY